MPSQPPTAAVFILSHTARKLTSYILVCALSAFRLPTRDIKYPLPNKNRRRSLWVSWSNSVNDIFYFILELNSCNCLSSRLSSQQTRDFHASNTLCIISRDTHGNLMHKSVLLCMKFIHSTCFFYVSRCAQRCSRKRSDAELCRHSWDAHLSSWEITRRLHSFLASRCNPNPKSRLRTP